MMITGIDYRQIVQARTQTQNFAGITVSPLLKELCALSDNDIIKLNNRCPKGYGKM